MARRAGAPLVERVVVVVVVAYTCLLMWSFWLHVASDGSESFVFTAPAAEGGNAVADDTRSNNNNALEGVEVEGGGQVRVATGARGAAGSMLSAVVLGMGAMVLWCYARTMLLGPGSVPAGGWLPPSHSTADVARAQRLAAVGQAQTGVVGWCDRCRATRPARAFHCRDCGCCQLKMEHHCAFTAGCVGHDNHKSFVLFLTYAVAGLGLAALLFFRRAYVLWTSDPPAAVLAAANLANAAAAAAAAAGAGNGTDTVGGTGGGVSPLVASALTALTSYESRSAVLSMLSGLVAIPGGLWIFTVLRFQVDLINRNTMSVERSGRKWSEHDAAEAGEAFQWPFDHGAKDAWREVMGRRLLLWPFPTRPDTNGFYWGFDTRWRSLEQLATPGSLV